MEMDQRLSIMNGDIIDEWKRRLIEYEMDGYRWLKATS